MNHSISELYRNLRDRDTKVAGFTVAEGRLLARRLLESALVPLGVAVTGELYPEFEPLVRGRCPLEVLEKGEMEEMAGFAFHRGVIALAQRPAPVTLEEFLTQNPRVRRLVAAPRVTDPENLGSLFRTASALGWDGVLVGSEGCDPYGRRCAKVSMGTLYSHPPILLPEASEARTLLHAGGWQSAAAVLEPGALDLQSYQAPARLVVWLGNEFEGLDLPWRKICDQALVLPMAEGVDSLNVAVAAGIFLYHLK